MDLIKKIDMFMLSETKTSITPYLNSVFNKQDLISKSQAEKLVKGLDSVTDKDTNFKVSIGVPLGKGKPQVIIKRKDGDYSTFEDKAKNVLSNNNFKVISSKKGDGGTWVVTFS